MENVEDWVRQSLARGRSPDELKQRVSAYGYAPDIVDKVMSQQNVNKQVNSGLSKPLAFDYKIAVIGVVIVVVFIALFFFLRVQGADNRNADSAVPALNDFLDFADVYDGVCDVKVMDGGDELFNTLVEDKSYRAKSIEFASDRYVGEKSTLLIYEFEDEKDANELRPEFLEGLSSIMTVSGKMNELDDIMGTGSGGGVESADTLLYSEYYLWTKDKFVFILMTNRRSFGLGTSIIDSVLSKYESDYNTHDKMREFLVEP